jgi:hypothetical protein
MKVIAYITDYDAVDRTINHLKLIFVADRHPAPAVLKQVALIAASAEYL